jgi:nitric oxide synthase oxygenase domain/subunit
MKMHLLRVGGVGEYRGELAAFLPECERRVVIQRLLPELKYEVVTNRKKFVFTETELLNSSRFAWREDARFPLEVLEAATQLVTVCKLLKVHRFRNAVKLSVEMLEGGLYEVLRRDDAE